MKRFFVILASVLLVTAVLVTSALAATAGGEITASAATATPGSTVEVVVSLYGFQQVNGISMGYNIPEGMELESAEWLLDGKIDDIDQDMKVAVWAPEDTADIAAKTPAFKLVYTMKEPQTGESLSKHITVSYKVKNVTGTVIGEETLTVSVALVIPATGITLDKSTLALDLKSNTTAVLVATATPANTTDNVIWETSDPSVVTVTGGTVTAIGKGTATVTAKAGSKSATCTVTVTCSHTLTEHPATEATCKATGNNLYYTCDLCGAILAADKATATTVAEQTLPTVGHAGGTATCTAKAVCKWCSTSYGDLKPHDYNKTVWVQDATNHWYQCKNCTATTDSATHDFQWVEDLPATQLENGKKHEECSVCHFKRNENTVIPHTHKVTHHEAVAATCIATGNVEYWTCESNLCTGVYYKNAACTETLTQITTAIDSSNHTGTQLRNQKDPTCYQAGYTGDTYCTATACGALVTPGTSINPTGNHVSASAWLTDEAYHWHACTTTGCQEQLSKTAHTFRWVDDVPATEDTTGIKHEECSCGLKRNENTVIEKLPHAHVGIQHYPAKAATCVATGNVEYWTCSSPKCAGKYYSNANCTATIEDVVTAINAENHAGTEVRGQKAPTCYQAGYTGDTYCTATACGKKISTGVDVPPTGNHVGGSTVYKNDTHHWTVCTTTGCGAEVGKQAHSYQWKLDKEATEDVTGLKHEECSCGVKRNENTVIPKLDHKHVGIQHHAAVKATCIKAGTLEYWTCSSSKCTGKYYADAKCQLELKTVTEAVNKDNHAGPTEVRNAKEATCSENGYTGDTYCTACKVLATKGSAIAATGKHTPKDGYLNDEKAHWQVCVHCNTVIGGAKAEHTLTWKTDKQPTEAAEGSKHQECTVCGYVCSQNTVIEKLKHTPTRVGGKAVSCTEDGVLEHFYCGNCGKYYSSVDGKPGEEIKKADTVIAATGHSFGEEWLSDANGHWHSCACGATSDPEAHTTEVVNAKDATETETGYTGDTVCTVCQAVVAEGQEIPVLGTEEPTVSETTTSTEDPTPSGDKSSTATVIVAACGSFAGIGAAAWILIVILKKRKH